jgi:hypothetical protein
MHMRSGVCSCLNGFGAGAWPSYSQFFCQVILVNGWPSFCVVAIRIAIRLGFLAASAAQVLHHSMTHIVSATITNELASSCANTRRHAHETAAQAMVSINAGQLNSTDGTQPCNNETLHVMDCCSRTSELPTQAEHLHASAQQATAAAMALFAHQKTTVRLRLAWFVHQQIHWVIVQTHARLGLCLTPRQERQHSWPTSNAAATATASASACRTTPTLSFVTSPMQFHTCPWPCQLLFACRQRFQSHTVSHTQVKRASGGVKACGSGWGDPPPLPWC